MFVAHRPYLVVTPSLIRRDLRYGRTQPIRLVILGCVLWALLPRTDARAEESPDTLVERALAHGDRGDWADAEPLLREAVASEGTDRQRFQLARVLARLDQVVEAATLAQSIANDPHGDLLFRDGAETLLQELRSRIATLVVRPPEPPPRIALALDGREISLRRARVGVPVDPGPHRLEARDPVGVVLGTHEAHLADGERLEVELASFLQRRVGPTALRAPNASLEDDTDGSALWMWVGLGSAAAVGVGILAAVLLSGEAQATEGDVPAISIGGGG